MALYFLEYDLRKPHRDYQRLYDELAEFEAVQILESLWCFRRYNTDATGLRDYFMRLIDKDDGIIVSEVTEWATYNTHGTPKDLRQHQPR
jgi:hypothetical protein